jgi:phospholipid/cholesterol/gamma-HCH transport system permease protein
VLSGEWHLQRASPRFEPLLVAALSAPALDAAPLRTIGFDAAALGTWVSSLLLFLRQAQEYGEAHALAIHTGGLPERVTQLLTLARAVPERVVDAEPAPPRRVERLGLVAIAAWDAAVAALTFLGEFTQSLARLFTGRTHMQWRAFWVTVQSNGSGAFPLVTLIALLVGVIIAFLGVVVLQRFGAGYASPTSSASACSARWRRS